MTRTASDDAEGASAGSVLTATLEPVDDGVRLVLEHVGLVGEDVVPYGAGWHAYLDRLPQGEVWPEVDWGTRYSALEDAYREFVEESPEANR